MGQPPKEYAKRSETSQLENLKSKLRSWVEVGGGIWAHKRKMLIIIASTESILCVSIVLSNSFVIISLCLPYHAGAQTVKHLPTVQETQVQSLGQEDLLEKGMATHSSTLAWKIPWMEEPGGLQSMGSQRVRHDFIIMLWGKFLLLLPHYSQDPAMPDDKTLNYTKSPKSTFWE